MGINEKTESSSRETKENRIENILDDLDINLYISDIDTDEILYANKILQKAYGLKEYKGKRCWEIFQEGKKERCSFCPIPRLLEMKKEGTTPQIIWREENSRSKRVYENKDMLIQWKGKLAHIQQSTDITYSENLFIRATVDELCQITNRRAGLSELQRKIDEKKERVISTALLDVNDLKGVNDSFGHSEGDFLLKEITRLLKYSLPVECTIFRLSGDEFVVIFPNFEKKEAEQLLEECLAEVRELQKIHTKPYGFGFAYGVYTFFPEKETNADEVLAKADAVMYSKKHEIKREEIANREKFGEGDPTVKKGEFIYDSKQFYDALVRSTDDFVYICNMKTGRFRYTPAAVKFFNLPSEIVPNPLPLWKDIVHPEDWERFFKANVEVGVDGKDYHYVEFRAKTCKGNYVWMRCRGSLMRDEEGRPNIFAGMMSQLEKESRVDSVTNIYNQNELKKRVEKNIQDPEVKNMFLMVIGLDDFTSINDMFDRNYGDFILKRVANLIQLELPYNAFVYKMDGDQFGILWENARKEQTGEMYCKLQKELQALFYTGELQTSVELSAGVAAYPEDGNGYNELYKYAGYALQHSKDEGKNRITCFEDSILRQKSRNLEIMYSLKKSMKNNYENFYLAFQPQVLTKSGRIKGVEALLRYDHPTLGKLSPLEFIPIMEQYGMIIDVGLWVFRQAIRSCRKWLEIDPDFVISVNVSRIQLYRDNFPSKVAQILEEEKMDSRNLILELTEGSIAENLDFLREKIEQLRSLGICIAIDDFGTQYSAMQILKEVPCDIVKIDRSFLRDILHSQFDASIISCIHEICEGIGMEVCQEGVETRAEFQKIHDMGIEYIQGFYFGEPQSEEKITESLVKRNSKKTDEK